MEAAPPSQFAAPRPALTHLRSVVSVLLAVFAGGLLRFWMLHKFFEVSGDSCLYGGIAKNLLLYGRYALGDGSASMHSTLIRLPGYPLFLAGCFQIFGMENYFLACCVQIVLDLLACGLLALFVLRISPEPWRLRASHITLWLAVLCPFTAIYAAAPLTESLSIFTIALAVWAAARFQDERDWSSALAFTGAVSYAALLRPDGVLVGVALFPAILLAVFRTASTGSAEEPSPAKPRRILLVCVLLALAPFALWTTRNWQTFHVVQPLAPRYATYPGEETWPGWQRWIKTWCLDFVSTFDVYWNMPGAPIDLAQLPARAFDSPAQYQETAAIVHAYEINGEDLTPEIDSRFAQLAAERIAAHPLRYYVWLPVGRALDMWFRPRVENLPIDLDWWVYSHHYAETRFSWFYAGLNAFYVFLALAGLWMRPRLWRWMLLYMILRSILLSTLEAPEARYTIECFPLLFALGGIALGRVLSPRSPKLVKSKFL